MIQTKQNGRRKLASISESEILRIQDDANNLNLFQSELFNFVGPVAQENEFVAEIEELKQCLRKFHKASRKQDRSFYNKPTLTSIRAAISCRSSTMNCTFNSHFK